MGNRRVDRAHGAGRGCVEGPAERGRGEARTGRGLAKGGFALVELLVAAVLLTIGILALASVLLGTSQRTSLVESQLDFAAAAESKVEDLWSAAFAIGDDRRPLSYGGSLTEDQPHHNDVYVRGDGRQFTRRWVVEAGPGDTRHVTVRVTARAGRTVARRDYETLIYPRW